MTYDLAIYITNLFVETLPKQQRTNKVLKELKIQRQGQYIVLQLLLGNNIIKIISEMKEEERIEWKESFHNEISQNLSNNKCEVLCVLNLQPMVRTVVLKISSDLVEEDRMFILNHLFEKMSLKLVEKYKGSVIGCYGQIVDDFFSIGDSYKKGRMLQEYHYIIGNGRCEFFQLISTEEKFSVVEYKYLYLFDELLEKEKWLQIFELLSTIKTRLVDNHIKDSKIMYIYKKIFSATIRKLFSHSEKYNKEIEILNNGVLMFEELFNDINDIEAYYFLVLNAISNITLYQSLNPHIKKTVHIIRNRFAEEISLDMIADEIGLSNAYLSRLFKEETKSNFKKYLTNVRIEKAVGLLIYSDKKISAVGKEVGYQTPTQFVRAFKVIEGMTPSKFRRYHK